MKVDIHAHAAKDIIAIPDKKTRLHVAEILKTGFYNLGKTIPQYDKLYQYLSEDNIEILYLKNTVSVLVISVSLI